MPFVKGATKIEEGLSKMGRCSSCNGPNCGNCLECHNPDCKDGVTVATDPRGQCRYKGKPIPIRKGAFDRAWDIAKEDDPIEMREGPQERSGRDADGNFDLDRLMNRKKQTKLSPEQQSFIDRTRRQGR